MPLIINKKTKIICTIGPSSETKEMVEKLYKAGMNVARLNFSHGTHEEHKRKIDIIRSFESEKIYIPIAYDTKGPEVRVGKLENDKIDIEKGQIIRIVKEDIVGNSERFSCTYKNLYEDIKIGDNILLDDGNLELIVIGKENGDVILKASNKHYLKSKKSMNLPHTSLRIPFISEKDKDDLRFACENDLDVIFASFVRKASDICEMKELLKEYGHPGIPILAKIENREGLDNIDEILDSCEGVMVARGDLGGEIPLPEVPIAQEMIVKKARERGKPVIVATQMLDSMTNYPRPTRAEVGDVANAIRQSCDCVMLSGETASGLYPEEAVKMQASIASTYESTLPYEKLAREAYETSDRTNNDAIANSIANTALLIGAELIINFSQTGRSSARIAKARPCCPIVSVTSSKHATVNSGWHWGVYSILLETTMPDFIEEMEALALKIARDLGLKPGDPVLLAGGTPTGAGNTNFMRILHVNELSEIFGD